jgi:hypothetical protein
LLEKWKYIRIMSMFMVSFIIISSVCIGTSYVSFCYVKTDYDGHCTRMRVGCFCQFPHYITLHAVLYNMLI